MLRVVHDLGTLLLLGVRRLHEAAPGRPNIYSQPAVQGTGAVRGHVRGDVRQRPRDAATTDSAAQLEEVHEEVDR